MTSRPRRERSIMSRELAEFAPGPVLPGLMACPGSSSEPRAPTRRRPRRRSLRDPDAGCRRARWEISPRCDTGTAGDDRLLPDECPIEPIQACSASSARLLWFVVDDPRFWGI